ncbi:MAG: histidine kinase [Syntrophotaleaceae bacterium]
MRFSKISVLAVLAAVMFFASNASAAVVIGGSDGWSFSTDGMVNLFMVYQNSDDIPDGVNPFYATDEDGLRIKNGFLPNILAFNIKAPTMNGIDLGARFGFYPSPSHDNRKNERFDSQIDMREMFFTADGNFGQIMVGKGLSLFLGQNLLTEQTLMGAGTLGSTFGLSAAAGVTLGRIGYGYLYPNFNAQFRYTTPDMGGFKVAVGLFDPSEILGVLDGVGATETKLPRVEAEVSYAGTLGGDTKFKAYANGMWQEADFTDDQADALGKDDVTAWGISGGFVVGMGGFELVGSAFTGEALGTALMLDLDSLDAEGEERETWGYVAQLTYTLANEGKTKFGVSYGANEFDETDADEAAALSFIESQAMLTFMATHDITPNLKIVGEISFLEHEWQNGDDWNAEQFNIGTFFIW